jgi:hypothetical protein
MTRLLFTCLTLSLFPASADECRVAVDGVGCHTRQLAVQKLWKALGGVTSVTIQPRGPSDPANQRIFLISSKAPLDQATLQAALGPRSRFYRILSVALQDSSTPALSKPAASSKVRP